VPAGIYVLIVHVDGLGFSEITEELATITINLDTLTIPNTITSLVGGSSLTINGNGFDVNDPYNNRVDVCGHPCVIDDSSNVTFNSL